MPTFYQNDLAIRNTADMIDEPIAVWSQFISGVIAVNLLVAFYDTHGRNGEVLIFSVPDTTRDKINNENDN
jgi:hypothetical protein